jgi:hypothetical protein
MSSAKLFVAHTPTIVHVVAELSNADGHTLTHELDITGRPARYGLIGSRLNTKLTNDHHALIMRGT